MDWTRNFFINWPNKDPTIARYFDAATKPIELWAQNEIRDYQTDMIRQTIKQAYQHNEFYTQKFKEIGLTPDDFRTMDDLQKFPFTTKDEVRQTPTTLLATAREEVSQLHISTGTTGGKPIYIYYTWDDVFYRELQPEYAKLAPIYPSDYVANVLPYEMSSAGLSFHKVIRDGYRATVIPIGKGGFYSVPEKGLQMMQDLAANVLITTPSYAVYLSEVAETMGIELGRDIKIERMWLTGEGCSGAFRDRVEQMWGCSALFWYGSLECGALGIECEDRQGYHVTNGHVVLEIVDPESGDVLGPGEIGEIVATTLLREGSPIIRYRTMDLGFIDDVPCSCGTLFPKLNLRGRQVDHIEIATQSYSPFYIEEHLMRIQEVGNSYQFVIKHDHLLIRTELAAGIEPDEDLAESIASRIEFGTGVPNRVEFVEKLPRTGGKTVRVVDERRTNS